jgi:hypothetical protein
MHEGARTADADGKVLRDDSAGGSKLTLIQGIERPSELSEIFGSTEVYNHLLSKARSMELRLG